jgi:hypothetical protein
MKEPSDPITDAVLEAAEESMVVVRAVHEALGLPLVTWKDGKVQYLHPRTNRPMKWRGPSLGGRDGADTTA